MPDASAGPVVVTGAFGYSGRYITRRLIDAGIAVRTLTHSPRRRHDFGDAVEVHPFNFDRPDALAASLAGARALINTYWVRFDHRDFNHTQAVGNTLRLFEAAVRAGVPRVVHVSITNPSADSPLPYFRGKAELESALRGTGLSHAILRPTVLFGREDILINNIAWMLRRFPVFGLFGDGQYKLQPIYVDDLAALAVEQALAAPGPEPETLHNCVIDAIGPETFTYRELVSVIGRAIGKQRPMIALPPAVGLAISRLLGPLVGDVIVTREEIIGLMQNLLLTSSPPAGPTCLTDWIAHHHARLGHRYSSELARRRDRTKSYDELRGA